MDGLAVLNAVGREDNLLFLLMEKIIIHDAKYVVS